MIETCSEQGELFEDFATNFKKKQSDVQVSPRQDNKLETIPKRDVCTYTRPKKHFTYNEYRRIFCGNVAAADYWWKKDMNRLEEESK